LKNGKQKTLVIAGGGTGGHIFPGLAVAEAWQKLGGQVIWVGSNLGKEKIYVPDAGIELRTIELGQMKGKRLLQKLKTLCQIPLAIGKSLGLLKKIQPDVVLGVGGYASFAVTLAAFFKKIPSALIEQNSFAGLTNRTLQYFVKNIFLSFEDNFAQFSPKKTMVVGNPIRSMIRRMPYPNNMRPFKIFVTGGSLGAKVLNEIFCQALDQIKSRWHDIEVIHQTGETDFARCKTFYEERPGLRASCQPFIRNMQEAYANAHLIICRSGASTTTEISIIGRPAIFVPYPFATDDHQKHNANYFVKQKAAWMILQKELNAKDLSERLEHLMDHSETLRTTADNMAQTAKIKADEKVAEALWSFTNV